MSKVSFYFIMRKKEITNRLYHYLFQSGIAFLITVIMLLLAFGMTGILPGGRYRAVDTDTYDQMTAMQAMLARHIKSGEGFFYSSETSFGQNTALLYAFCAYSPTTFLFIVFSDIYTAMIVGMLLKPALSASFFCFFLNKGLRWKGCDNIFFSLCYGLCGFTMEYLLSVNLLDGLYMLPLVMLALMYAIRKMRFMPLTVTYALSFIIQFYCGFLIGIFSVAALAGILYLRDGKGFIKNNKVILIKYVLSAICAIFLALPLLLPALCYFGGSTGFNSVMERGIPAIWDVLYGLFFGRPTLIDTNIPFLYCGTVVLLLIPVYFTNKTIDRREKILMGIALASLFLSIYVDPVYYFLHAFNRPDGFTARFIFLYVFLMVILAKRAFQKLVVPDKKRIMILFSIEICICVLSLLMHNRIGEADEGKGIVFGLVGCSVVYMLWLGVAFMLKKNKKMALVMASFVLCAELFAQLCYNSAEQGRVATDVLAVNDRETDSIITTLKNDSSANEYRVAGINVRDMNHSAMYGYKGFGQFASSNYSSLQYLLFRLGYSSNAVKYTAEGATDLTEMLFGVRYVADFSGEKGIRINTRALPIGFVVSPEILKKQELLADPFEMQNNLLSALCGEEMEVYHKADVLWYSENAAIYNQSAEGYSIINDGTEEYGSVMFSIPKNGYEHAYAYFRLLPPGNENDSEQYLEPENVANVALFSPSDRTGNGLRNGLFADNTVMEMTEGDGSFNIVLADYDKEDKAFNYYDQYFVYQDESILDNAGEILKNGNWDVEQDKENDIIATVIATERYPVLFVTIPYDKGWHARIEGIERELIPVVNDTFMALPMEIGTHTVELYYEAPGEAEGRMMGTVGMVLLLTICLGDHRRLSGDQGNLIVKRED